LQRPKLSCPWLRSATLAICANLQDEAVSELCRGAPLLHELSLWRCSSLVKPVIRAPYLHTLNLCECAELRDRCTLPCPAPIPQKNQIHPLLQSNPYAADTSLRRAHRAPLRSPTSHPSHTASLTTIACVVAPCVSALHALPSSCARLSSLLVAGCVSLSPAAAHWGGGAALTTLDVSDMAATTDAQLRAACDASPELRRIDLSRSGAGVVTPLVGGTQLVSLVAKQCEHLADDAVSAACNTSPLLTTLVLSLCSALHSPRVHGAVLAELNLSGCTLLQDAAVNHACAHSPSLTKLCLSRCNSLVEPVVTGAKLRRVEMAYAEQCVATSRHQPISAPPASQQPSSCYAALADERRAALAAARRHAALPYTPARTDARAASQAVPADDLRRRA
jgi:hypothetical protein